MNPRRIWAVALTGLLGSTFRAWAAVNQPLQAGRVAEIRAHALKGTPREMASLARDWQEKPVRDLTLHALGALTLGVNSKQAEDLLRKAFAQQTMDPASAADGTVPWQPSHPEIKDANAIEFTMMPIGPILLGYGDRLSPAFKKELMPHWRAGLEAVRRHSVRVSYTNIYLMKTMNLILLGEALSDTAARQEGLQQLASWTRNLKEQGINEYDSPVYYAVDLGCLQLGARYAADADERARFAALLNYFWTDIAANFFPGRESLSGPHSRDYDFLFGEGGLDNYLYAAGWRKTRKNLGEWPLILESRNGPDDRLRELAFQPNKVVLQRWGAEAGMTRYNDITPDFAIGSVSHDSAPHDKPIAIELASAKRLPVISVVPDSFDAPYGLVQPREKSGHAKVVHLPLHPSTVQEKGLLLALLDLEPPKDWPGQSFATNILLPAQADAVLLDGRTVHVDTGLHETANTNTVIGIQEGSTGVAMRIFYAEGADGQSPQFLLQADATGFSAGAIRYSAYHYRGDTREIRQPHIRVGLLFYTQKIQGSDDLLKLMRSLREAEIQNSLQSSWHVTTKVDATTLEILEDPRSRRVQQQRINGQDMTFDRLSVNGQNITPPLP